MPKKTLTKKEKKKEVMLIQEKLFKLIKGWIMAAKINLLTIFLSYLKSKGRDSDLENCKRSEL